ncbi:MAG: ADP-ribosylglycohydrolase family protein [Bacteroidota bacterium]
MRYLSLCLISMCMLLWACPAPTPQSMPGSPLPSTTEAAMKQIEWDRDSLYDKMLGVLLGSAIGDAMGAPTEMWPREKIQLMYGHVQDLDNMVREPSPEGTWGMNLPAGSTTDDTRWKAFMVDFFTGENGPAQARKASLKGADFGQAILDRHDRGIAFLKQIESNSLEPFEEEMRKITWLKEWAVVARPYVADDLQGFYDSLSSFYGGEMVCAGMLFAPMIGAAYAGDPAWAYQQTYQMNFFDLGYARDISGLTAAMVAGAMAPGAAPDSILPVVQSVDPQGYFSSRLVGRTAYKLYEETLWMMDAVNKVKPEEFFEQEPAVLLALPLETAEDSLLYARLSTAYQLLDEKLMRYPFHPAEIYLVNAMALLFAEYDFEQALAFVINYGRDNDTTAAVTGSILGGLYGAKALPKKLTQPCLKANRELGFDLEKMAQRMVDAILGPPA